MGTNAHPNPPSLLGRCATLRTISRHMNATMSITREAC
jgi:hypothetical protein